MSSERPSRWRRSNARNATGRPGSPRSVARARRRRPGPRRRPRRARRRARRAGVDPDRHARRAPAARRRVAPGPVDDPDVAVAGRSAGPTNARARGGRPRTARTGGPPSRTARAAGAAASAASAPAGSRGERRARAAATAGRASSADGSAVRAAAIDSVDDPPPARPSAATRPGRQPARPIGHPGGARAATRSPRRPVPPPRPDRPAPVARRRAGRVHASSGRAVGKDGYRHAIWLARRPTAATPARQLTIGVRHDRTAGSRRTAGRSRSSRDRRLHGRGGARPAEDAKEREDGDQVHLLPLDGGEARRLTDLPRGVDGFAWSPDGRSLAVLDASLGATREEDRRQRGRPRQAEARRDAAVRLPLHRPARLPVQRRRLHLRPRRPPVARRRRRPARPGRWSPGRRPSGEPAWSPGRHRGSRSRRTGGRDHDLERPVGDLSSSTSRRGEVTPIAGGARRVFGDADLDARRRADRSRSATGSRGGGYRSGIWLFAADGSDAAPSGGTDLLARQRPKPDAGDEQRRDARRGRRGHRRRRTARASCSRRRSTAAYELWRVALDGDGEPERLTTDAHYLSGWDARPAAGDRDLVVAVRSAPTSSPRSWRSRRARRRAHEGAATR